MNTSLDHTDPFAQVLQKELANVWNSNLHCSLEERDRLVNSRKRELAAMLGVSDLSAASRPVKVPRTMDPSANPRSQAVPATGLPASAVNESSLSKSAPSTVPISMHGPDPTPLSHPAVVDFAPTQVFGQGIQQPQRRTRRALPCSCFSRVGQNRPRSRQDLSAPRAVTGIENGRGHLPAWESDITGTFGRDQPFHNPYASVTSSSTTLRPRTASAPISHSIRPESSFGVPGIADAASATTSGEVMAYPALTRGTSHRHSDVGTSNAGVSNIARALSNVSDPSHFKYGAGDSPPCTCSLLARGAGGTMGHEDLSHSFRGSGQDDQATFPFSFPPSYSFVNSVQPESTLSHNALPRPSSPAAAEDMTRDQSPSHSQTAQANRAIAPKPSGVATTVVESNNRLSIGSHQVNRITSADGSSKDVVAISKAPYIRPHYPKKMCPHCTKHPEGFRGEHELRRHIDRAHNSVKKMWICIDPTPQKTFLANCKSCRNTKKYNAYYNAAAHLRRAHFNPRKHRGRGRGRVDEKRGGKGGGDHPPMEQLKKYMREIEVHVPEQSNAKSDEEEEEEDSEGSATAPNPDVADEGFDFRFLGADAAQSHGDASIPASFPDPPFLNEQAISHTPSLYGTSPQLHTTTEASAWPETWASFDYTQHVGGNGQSLAFTNSNFLGDLSNLDCSPSCSHQQSPWSLCFDDAELPFPMQQ